MFICEHAALCSHLQMEREKTKGGDWYNLPATEMTSELRKDLKLIQMRDSLDPKTHYRKNDRRVLPKYFQVCHLEQFCFYILPLVYICSQFTLVPFCEVSVFSKKKFFKLFPLYTCSACFHQQKLFFFSKKGFVFFLVLCVTFFEV